MYNLGLLARQNYDLPLYENLVLSSEITKCKLATLKLALRALTICQSEFKCSTTLNLHFEI